MDFNYSFEQTKDEIKLKFLQSYIVHDKALQKAFLKYLESQNNGGDITFDCLTYQQFVKQIENAKRNFVRRIEEVDLENPDWESYLPLHDGYIPEYEQYEQASEQEFRAIYNSEVSYAVDQLIRQRIDLVLCNLIGVKEACVIVEVDDPLETFGDMLEDFFVDEYEYMLKEIVSKVKKSPLSDFQIKSCFKLFFDYCDSLSLQGDSFVTSFEQFLIAIADRTNNANQLLDIIDQSTVDRNEIPQLTLLLNKLEGNDEEWLNNAQKYYRLDKEIAKQLINYYYEKDKVRYKELANELYNENDSYWSTVLKETISEELDEQLFVNVFYTLSAQEKEIAYYRKIKNILPETKKASLLKQVNWDKGFCVEILVEEERYEEVKEIVKYSIDEWNYNKLIAPILNIYPEFCFNSISQKLRRDIDAYRGRDAYCRIASTIKIAQEIKGFEDKVECLTLEIYNYKPTLPALRDEFRKAGLVKE